MQVSKYDDDFTSEQRAFTWLLKKTIQHGYDSDDLGKTLIDIFRENKMPGAVSPPVSPAQSPRTTRTRPGNPQMWNQSGNVASIPKLRKQSVDASADDSASESATPRGSDNEGLEPDIEEISEDIGIGDKKKKKKWYDSFKKKSSGKSRSASDIFDRQNRDTESIASIDEESWQQSNISEADSDTEETPKKSKSNWRMLLNPKARKTIDPPPVSTSQYFEEQLDQRSLHELIMMMLLICPNNDGPDNYRVVGNRLERFGDGPMFVKPIQNDVELHCRSILFCFDTMLMPIHPGARARILEINNKPFQEWFTLLKKLKLPLRSGLAEEMYVRRRTLQRVLNSKETITLMDLMRKLDPELFYFYQVAFEHNNVMARYTQLPRFKPVLTETLDPKIQLENFKKFRDQYQDKSLPNEVHRKATVRVVNSEVKIRDLDLSRTVISNVIIPKMTSNCPQLRSLILADTPISQIEYPLMITHLDLSRTQVDHTIFMALRENCRNLKYLKLAGCNKLTSLSIQDFNFLIELDVSDCPNLTQINSTMKQSNKILSSPRKAIIHSKLRVLRANRCVALNHIVMDDAENLQILQANGNALVEVSLSMGLPLPSLRVLELNDNPELVSVVANPIRLVWFTVFASHKIKTLLNETCCQMLLNLIERAEPDLAASAMTVLMRVKENAIVWVVRQRGDKVFTKLELPGFDATNANLAHADFTGTNLTNAIFINACLTKAKLCRTKLTGVNFGQLPIIRVHDHMVMAIDHIPGKALYVSADASGKVILRTNQEILLTLTHNTTVNAVKFSPDGTKFAVAGYKQKYGKEVYLTCVYDVQNYQQLFEASDDHTNEIRALAFSLDGVYLLSASEDGKVIMRFVASGKIHKILDCMQGKVQAISMHPNRILFATAGSDGTIVIWNIKTASKMATIKAHERGVNCLIFSQDGKCLVSGGEDKKVNLWNVSNWQCYKTLIGHKVVVNAVNVSPDNQLVFSGDALGYPGQHTLMVWSIKTGELLQQFGHDAGIYAIDVEPSQQGTWLVHTGCGDKCVRRFHVTEAKQTYPLERSDFTNVFDANQLDINECCGLSQDGMILLKQMGAEGEPATQEQLRALAEEEMFDIDESESVAVVLNAPGLY